MKKNTLLLIGLFILGHASGQNFYGLQNSNFAGVHAMYINPAGLADSRFSQHTNVSTFGFNFFNDYMKLETPFTPMDIIRGRVPAQYKHTTGGIKWDPAWVKEDLNGNPKNMNFGLEWRGPAGMTNVGSKLAIGAGMRTRTSFQLYNVSEELARFTKAQIDSNPPPFTTLTNNTFALNMNAYQEISGTAAAVLFNRKALYLKGGATIKYLMGLGSAYAINNGVSIQTAGSDTVIFNKTDVSVGYTNTEFLNKLINQGTLGAALPSFKNINGGGYGFDFGVVFEWRPAITDALTDNNRYLLKGGISLLDWGKISYNNNINLFAISNTTPVVFDQDSALSAAFAQGINEGLAFVDSFAQKNFNYTRGPGKLKSSIPTTLNFQVDWNILKKLYLGVNWQQSVVSKKDIAFRRPSSLVLIPRFETRLIEVSTPLSLYNDYKDVAVGMFVKVGPVFIGSDNLIKSLQRSSFSGIDLYFGVSYGIPRGKNKKK
ncbi:MAG: hypothetical protein JNL57_10055 [Bacteroidetes bacterium]|nr:hypothetical protein [Bacteroidota bacterium]